MSESQTLKTMVHETAHAMLHSREVEKDDLLAPVKDRNTKEVEAESIAYTVCQHFGIDTAEIVEALSAMNEDDRLSIAAYLESRGAWTTELGNEKTEDVEEFHLDVRYNLDTEVITDIKAEKEMDGRAKEPIGADDVILKITHAEGIINRLEFAKTTFSDDEKNLIVNYAFKLNDMEKTRELAEHIYYEEAYGNQGAALATIDAQAEIDTLPDPMIGIAEMHEYGYIWEEMLPLTKETAMELFERDLPVYQLHEGGSETLIEGEEQITEYEGIFGIEKNDWEDERAFRSMQEELAEGTPEKEAQLLYGDTDRYGIYLLKDSPELRDFHFAGTAELLRRNLLSDDFKEIQPGNYNLIYTGELSDIQGQTQSQRLGALFEKFNIDHPADYKGHSLSVSDVVVLHEGGKNSTHFVDSYGFTELPHFTRALEGVKEQEAGKVEIEFTDEENFPEKVMLPTSAKPVPV